MKPSYIPSNNIKALAETLLEIQEANVAKTYLFLMAEKDAYRPDDFLSKFVDSGINIFGGIFPSLIVDGNRIDEGLLLVPLPFELNIQRIDLNQDVDGMIHDLSEKHPNSLAPDSTLFVFFDGLSNQKAQFTDSLFNYFGINATYIGGGAGSLSFNAQPCIIDNEGVHENSAIVAWTNNHINIGSAHGWQSISEPLKITKAENNKVDTLGWEPAFEVYSKVIKEHSGAIISKDNFFDIAKSYPLGIKKMDAEMVVRDPFAVEKKALRFFDSIQEGEYVEILHGNMDSLLEGAKQAKMLASKQKLNDCGGLCIDCISRAMFMGDDFQLEMDTIKCSTPLYGVLTIGEIANSGESYLEIFNKTVVLGLW